MIYPQLLVADEPGVFTAQADVAVQGNVHAGLAPIHRKYECRGVLKG